MAINSYVETAIASIVHEVTQPLFGTIMNLGLCTRKLEERSFGYAGARSAADRATRDANRALEIIAHLRDLFMRKPLDKRPSDLSEIVRDVLEDFSPDLHQHRVALQVQLESNAPDIAVDRIQIERVVLNLVKNSMDALSVVPEPSRKLRIQTMVEEEGLTFSVTDSGVGIQDLSHDTLFAPFASTKTSGMGIGLYLSRMIVEAHGGNVWSMHGQREGSTFGFTLPWDVESSSRHAAVLVSFPLVPREAERGHP